MIHARNLRLLTVISTIVSMFASLGANRLCSAAENASAWETNFQTPPDSAKPWVYWFWLNSNITREGLTADLEAMKQAGIGGVLIMEVDQGAPVGDVPFAGPKWLELFKHACAEAKRLNIEINMNNDAGWNGSGGPWIKPEQSMQKIVWTDTQAEGPRKFQDTLAQPQAVANYYEDITVMAFPTPAENARIPNLLDKAAYNAGLSAMPAPAAWPAVPAEGTVAPDKIVALTEKMDKAGRLVWDVPEGKWTILRIGHTSTGKENHPTPASGCGLECDKMSKEAAETHFAGLMGKIIAECGPLVGQSLVATHIDSWENGSQNWTPKFREEFKSRRGYDLMPYFPVMTGRIVGSREKSERFLWDVRQTVGELVLQNYAGHFREMAHRHGMRLSIEHYTWCPCDELAYGGYADEPMGEFWAWWFGTNKKYGFSFSSTEAASAAHVYGKKIVGAEAFTACDSERWQGHPAIIKDLGDWAFCEGINRFVFHRYAMQPWLTVQPGMTMGPWGLHYERTQTWWGMSKAWHDYLARCQYLLREGLFVADVCYLGAEASPQSIMGQKRFLAKKPDPLDPQNPDYPRDRLDYSFDLCSTEALLTRMSVKDGRLTLPDGMSYRLLGPAQRRNHDAETAGQDQGVGRSRGDGRRLASLEITQLKRLPAMRRQSSAACRVALGFGRSAEKLTERKVGTGRMFWSAAFQKKPNVSKSAKDQLHSAQWIWHAEGNPAASTPPGSRYFQKSFAVEGEVKSAQLAMTADNEFAVWIDGAQVGDGHSHTRTYTFDVAHLLKQGQNWLSVEAVNGTDSPSPAGLIGTLSIQYRDGRKQIIVTDKSWKSAQKAEDNWISKADAPDGWTAAMNLGALGMAPWGNLDTSAFDSELYPEVDLVADVLKKIDVKPDFTYQTVSGTKSLRYIHRNDEGKDIYFVANKLPQREQAVCSFRVQGKRPEFWWPDTGRIEYPAACEEADGAVRVPISFGPVESVFVIFRDKATAVDKRIVSVARDGKELFGTALRAGASSPPEDSNAPLPVADAGVKLTIDAEHRVALEAEQPGSYTLKFAGGDSRRIEVAKLPPPIELSSDWDVRFDPKRGGPESVKFDKLVSWSDRAEEGVKFYSGTAAYVKKFTVPADLISPDRKFAIDLGRVEVMAQVTLNGKDLGILWKTPYKVDISGAIQPGENSLEVKVVNLPINRQIGDEFLPEDSDRNPDGTLEVLAKMAFGRQVQPDRPLHLRLLASLAQDRSAATLRPPRPRANRARGARGIAGEMRSQKIGWDMRRRNSTHFLWFIRLKHLLLADYARRFFRV